MSGERDQYPTAASFYRDGVLYVAFNGTNAETAEDFIRGVNELVKLTREACTRWHAAQNSPSYEGEYQAFDRLMEETIPALLAKFEGA